MYVLNFKFKVEVNIQSLNVGDFSTSGYVRGPMLLPHLHKHGTEGKSQFHPILINQFMESSKHLLSFGGLSRETERASWIMAWKNKPTRVFIPD